MYKKKIISYSIMSCLLSTQLISCTALTNKIEENLKSDNISEAVKQILVLRDDEDINKSTGLVLKKAVEIKDDYINSKIDSTLAISYLQKLRLIPGATDEIEEIIEEIKESTNSNIAYLNGIRFESEENYKEALYSYLLVSEKDNEHYEIANNKIKELYSILKSESKVDVNEIKLISSNRSKDSYHNTLQIVLKNKSSKNIIGVNVSIMGFNKENNRVTFNTNGSEEDFFYGALQDINIGNQEWGRQYNWMITSNEKLNAIDVCIQSVKYSDGSTWENPLYDYWIQENSIQEN